VAEFQEALHLGKSRGRVAGRFSAGRLIAGAGSPGRRSPRSKELPAVETHGIGRLTNLPVGQTAVGQIPEKDA
jgi:hypothetical protein